MSEIGGENRWRVGLSRLRGIVGSWDFLIGLAGGVSGGFAVLRCEGAAKAAPDLLIGMAGIGAALLAIVMAAVTIFAVLIDDEYRRILELADGTGRRSISSALFPYKVVIAVSGIAAISSLLAYTFWAALSEVGQASAFAIGLGSTLWCVAGTVQVSFLSLLHAEWKAKLEARRAENDDPSSSR